MTIHCCEAFNLLSICRGTFYISVINCLPDLKYLNVHYTADTFIAAKHQNNYCCDSALSFVISRKCDSLFFSWPRGTVTGERVIFVGRQL